jgi:hypothetical protein
VKSGVKSGSVKKAVSTVKDAFSTKAADAELLVGTWNYVEPAVLGTSGNLLVKAVGNASASKLEKLLAEYYEKGNVTPENTFITFHKDGTFFRSIAGHEAKGTWMVSGNKVFLAMKNVQTAAITTQKEDDYMMFVVEAEKILDLLTDAGVLADSKTNEAIIKLAKNLSGIEGGFTLVKKH